MSLGPVFSDGTGGRAARPFRAGPDDEPEEVLQAIVDAITTAYPEIHGYALLPSVTAIKTPSVVVYPPDLIRFGDTFDDVAADFPAGAEIRVPIRVYVKQVLDTTDQRDVYRYAWPRGSRSIWKVFRSDPTLDGLVEDVRIVEARNFGLYPIASTPFLGFEILLAVTL